MPRKQVERLPKVQCDGPGVDHNGRPNEAERCENLVSQTRPSKSGRHYCSQRVCQNARIAASKRVEGQPSARLQRLWELQFIHSLATSRRVHCPSCGLVDAVPGWPHRDAKNLPCRALVREPSHGRSVQVDLIDAVWPADSADRTYRDAGSF